ncbi:DNA repair protein RAD33 [Kluyveromyces marxianus]|uniref:DNA repair protein RAD33 n=2 Tax=Kluyveromyces marxianus TaxID=4911 RepID=W0TET5_KLUMD|nr:DNA repair protein RAD33 [Kluyveromyces marxianus DMKU3-1042]QGN16361.1 DNA repair protein RAD33 [Kluyveromyces marxianus]BAO40629.1 DNA repair protein RAD33 [Kluyveromyces marxianus DMKU3-1042]BAP72110.1 DNA repair protein RAD33 [Kluyveromyces marxianus]
MGKKSLSYDTIDKWEHAHMPYEIEDEVLNLYVKFTEESELKWVDIALFYEQLEVPKEWVSLLEPRDLCIDGLDVIDFDKLMDTTYRLLIFMDNAAIIDKQWELLLRYSGRMEQFPNVSLRKHVLSVKDVQKAAVQVDMDQSMIVSMVSWATNGERVFVTYIDFAHCLGKMGVLRY